MPGSALNEYGLTDCQELFVSAYVSNGGNGTKAAIAAGYAEAGAHTRAYELLRMPKIQARMDTLTRAYMSECAPAAVKALMTLAVGASSETVRQAAASSLLDRTGYKAPILVQVQDNRTQDDIDKELAILLGLDVGDLAASQPADGSDTDAPVH